MSDSSLNDSTVLRGTKFSPPDTKGRVQLSFELPSGRKITSTDWLVPGEIKGRVLIAWADAIRAEDAYDIQERAERQTLARAERRAQELGTGAPVDSGVSAVPNSSPGSPASATSSAEASKASSTTSALPDDPAEMIYAKLESLRIERAKVADQLLQSQTRLDNIQRSISRWEAVGSGLGLPLEKPSDEVNKEPSQDADQVPVVDVGSILDPAPVPARRTPRAQRRGRGTVHGNRRGGQGDSGDQLPRAPQVQVSGSDGPRMAGEPPWVP